MRALSITSDQRHPAFRMGIMPLPRLIAIDIDGTLLDPHFQVTEANMRALRGAHERGVEIALVTGRRHAFALPIAEVLGLPITMVSSNGAVTRSSTGELFHRDLMPRSAAVALIEHMTEFREHFVLTFDRTARGTLVCESADQLNVSIRRWMEKNAEYLQFVRPVERALTEDPVQSMFAGGVARMTKAQEHLLSNPALLKRITVLKTQYDERDLCIIDVLNAGVSKGHALRRWAEHHGIPRENIVAIGDNFNDIEMLDYAGIPFIMGNACEELRSAGYRITLGNDQSGVAHAVEQVLGPS
jgi:Cof subfamily protein (haloacid dehalogenase superfamily)